MGARYILFLTGGEDCPELSILMGYELKAGKVFPLDKTGATHPISAYKGRDEAGLIEDLLAKLSK